MTPAEVTALSVTFKVADKFVDGVQIQNADRFTEGLGIYFNFIITQSGFAFKSLHPFAIAWMFENDSHQCGVTNTLIQLRRCANAGIMIHARQRQWLDRYSLPRRSSGLLKTHDCQVQIASSPGSVPLPRGRQATTRRLLPSIWTLQR